MSDNIPRHELFTQVYAILPYDSPTSNVRDHESRIARIYRRITHQGLDRL